MKSIWEKIKLAFERKPAGDVLIPEAKPAQVEEIKVIKPRRTRAKKVIQ